MKTFFTIIPLQRGNDLKGCIYQAVDNSDLQMDTPTCFPIMTAMNAYAKPGEEIRSCRDPVRCTELRNKS